MIDPGDLYYVWHRRQWFLQKFGKEATSVDWPVHPKTQAEAEVEAARIAASLNAQPPKSGVT